MLSSKIIFVNSLKLKKKNYFNRNKPKHPANRPGRSSARSVPICSPQICQNPKPSRRRRGVRHFDLAELQIPRPSSTSMASACNRAMRRASTSLGPALRSSVRTSPQLGSAPPPFPLPNRSTSSPLRRFFSSRSLSPGSL